MAVPSSGELSWGKIAMERLTNSYTTYSQMSYGSNVPVYNIFKAGNTGGGATAGSSYPALNSSSPSYAPINQRAIYGTLFSASMWYDYDQDAASGYTLKRKVNISDSSGDVTGDNVETQFTMTGGSPSSLTYNYSTTFGGSVPYTTTNSVPTTNKYTAFTKIQFNIASSGTLTQSGFGPFGDWGMNSVTKNSPSPGTNPGPTTGFGSGLGVFDWTAGSSRGTPGFIVYAVPNTTAMSYSISSGDTVYFDYSLSIAVY